jgi:4-diphosphocytidyl-2-C-methyl-D-erythritol kinase
MGAGRGERVSEAPDLPSLACVVVTPEVGISTPQAFADWDKMAAPTGQSMGLTERVASDRIKVFSRMLRRWLRGSTSGVPGAIARDRAEALLLDLVRTGIENDFEAVVFPQHPELREVKKALIREGAGYASLSGSGSAVYGLFASPRQASQAAARLREQGLRAVATRTLPRREYWRKM